MFVALASASPNSTALRFLLSPRSRRASLAAAMEASTASTVPLRGVVFDMDGTLTVPNLDFDEMYRRANVPRGDDILSPKWRHDPVASAVVQEMEEEGRRTLRLMPGAGELATWLHSHRVPVALVTRNSRLTVAHFHRHVWPAGVAPMSPAISRDDDHPPKPDPTAFASIAGDWGIPPGPEWLMVGDSPRNDIAFGKAAGARTALLDVGGRHAKQGFTNDPDIYVEHLSALAGKIWQAYHVDSPLCSLELHAKRPVPVPSSAASIAAAGGHVETLGAVSLKERSAAEESTGNTPLIWAADAGHIAAVEALLGAGVDVDVRGFIGATAVSRAARRGHIPVLKALLTHGVDTNIPNDKLQCPLHFAAFKLQREAVSVLLHHNANPLVLDRKGRTPAEDTSDEGIRAQIREAQGKYIDNVLYGNPNKL